jgi:hypothetical protein
MTEESPCNQIPFSKLTCLQDEVQLNFVNLFFRLFSPDIVAWR